MAQESMYFSNGRNIDMHFTLLYYNMILLLVLYHVIHILCKQYQIKIVEANF